MTKSFPTLCAAGVLLTLSLPSFAAGHTHRMHHARHRTAMHGRMASYAHMTVHPTRDRNTNGRMNGSNSIETPASRRRSVTPPAAITNNGQDATTGGARPTRP